MDRSLGETATVVAAPSIKWRNCRVGILNPTRLAKLIRISRPATMPRAASRVTKSPHDRGANSQAPQQHARPTQTQIREQFFNDKLAQAQRHLDEMKRVLDALGDKLDAAKPNEHIEVETEADAVEELIFRYNDALESARDAAPGAPISHSASKANHCASKALVVTATGG